MALSLVPIVLVAFVGAQVSLVRAFDDTRYDNVSPGPSSL